MNYLSIENISKTYGHKDLFSEVSFGIDKGQKIAIIAKNGGGKSTLLKIIAKKESADEGIVTFRKEITVGYLDQKDEFTEKNVIYEICNSEYPKLQQLKPFIGNEENISEKELWNQLTEIQKVLDALNLSQSKEISTMSGGEKKRLSLAKVLIEKPDLLLLDEPTNHLDLDMIEWLEKYLSQQHLSVLLVTHDRYFLEAVCDQIIEIDQGKTHLYKGNFSYFLEKKALRQTVEQQTNEKNKNLLKKELDWIRRQPKARGTKSKSRVDSFYKLKETTTSNKGAADLNLKVDSARMGSKILEFHNVSMEIDNKILLKNFSYKLSKGDKIGIVGKNGVGKSTFLNLILKELQPTAGKIVIGETIEFAYYRQQGIKVNDDKRVIEVVKEIAEYIPLEKGKKITALQLLLNFNFQKEKHYQLVSKLSGGEKKRLMLLTLLMKNPNFFILDEPTNDLDIYTMSALEDFLNSFQGCVFVVSHDRYFLDKICDHIFYFKGEGEIKSIMGNYEEYRKTLNQQEKNNPIVKPQKEKPKSQTKTSYKDKRELGILEKEIEKLEKQKNELEAEINNPNIAYEKITEISQKLGEIIEELDEKSDKWLALSELQSNNS